MISILKRGNRPLVDISTNGNMIADKIIKNACSYQFQNIRYIDARMYKCPSCGWWKLIINASSSKCGRCGTQCELDEWDGEINLSKVYKGITTIPMGLTERVENTLIRAGYEVSRNMRQREPENAEWIKWDSDLVPREMQNIAIDNALKTLYDGMGKIISAPTGSGKTILGVNLITKLMETTLIVVPRLTIAEQWKKAIEQNTDASASVWGGKRKGLNTITITTIAAMSRKNRTLNKFPVDMFGLVIIDECHHTPATSLYELMTNIDPAYRLGLSATPYREDGETLKMIAALGEPFEVTTARELITQKVLSKPVIEILKAPTNVINAESYAEMYDSQIVNNVRRNRLIADKAISRAASGESVLIAVNRIKHGETLAAMTNSTFIHGQTDEDERKRVLDEFRNKKMLILVSTLLGEGVDIPSLDTIIIAGGGKSKVGHTQVIGRALRRAEGKSGARIIDVIDETKWLRNHAEERLLNYKELFG